MPDKHSTAELIRLLEDAIRDVGDIDADRFYVLVRDVKSSGSPIDSITASVLVRFLPTGAPFCCGEPSCYSIVFRDEGLEELSDYLWRKMDFRQKVSVDLDVAAEYFDGIEFGAYSNQSMLIRPEKDSDQQLIRNINLAAFPTPAEADIVDRLRGDGNLSVSLLAIDEGEIVGHIAFSPVSIEGHPTAKGGGLAPVAVHPDHQGRGYGGALIRRGIDACRENGFKFLVVLGAPGYYSRFGFQTASRFGLTNEYGVDQEFMVIELVKNYLDSFTGLVRYGDEFRDCDQVEE